MTETELPGLTPMEKAPILQTGFAIRGSNWESDDKDLPPRVPTTSRLKNLCREYGIKNVQDAIWMDEFTLGDGGRVDMLTVDLRTHFIRGFEVKNSRADFRSDTKWHLYLKYFNYFFFVTPPGVVRKGELPAEVYHLEWTLEEPPRRRRSSWGSKSVDDDDPPIGYPFERLVVRKRGQRLQPKFTRETYTEHFFNRLMLQYVRNLKWRSDRWGKVCKRCLGEIGQ